MLFPMKIPLFINFYLFYDLLYERDLINLNTQILILIHPIKIILLPLWHLCGRQPLTLVLIILQNIQHESLPEVILIGAIHDGWHPI
jgi:hypothetical protein